MNLPTRVRAAVADEHKAILAIARQSRFTKDFSNRVMFSSDAAYQKGWIRVVENDDKQLMGFTCVREKVREPAMVLYFIGIHRDFQRCGLGKLLIRDLIVQTRHRRLVLNVHNENTQALAFYATLGFRIVGTALGGHGTQLELTW